jgi:apoptosis-inducing factor 2
MEYIVILGGSYAALSTAHYLLKHVVPKTNRPEAFQVVLISPSQQTMVRTASPRALISDTMFDQNKLFPNIAPLFEQYGKAFKFVHGRATAVDTEQRTVTISLADSKTETINYHSLVIATGTSCSSPLLGPTKDIPTLKTNWEAFRKALPSAKQIIIGGGGPAGVETAGELGEHLNGKPSWFSSRNANPKVSITLITAGKQIIPLLRPSLAAKAETYLAAVGVTVLKNTRITTVSPESAGEVDVAAPHPKVTLDNGDVLDCDLYIPAVGAKPNTSFLPASILATDGRVQTNKATLRVPGAGDRVYALGDVADAAKAAVPAIFAQVPVLAASLKRDMMLAEVKDGKGGERAKVGEDKAYVEDTRETHIVPIGKSRGVGAVMGWAVPGWFVWLMKGRDYWMWTVDPVWSGKQFAKES